MRNPSMFLKLSWLLILVILQIFFASNIYAATTKPIHLNGKAAGLAFVETAYPQDMTAGDKQDLVYVIQNTGTAATKLVVNGFLPPMVRDNTVPNNCGDTLAPGAMCYIKLTTTPTDEMAFKQMLLINNGALAAPLNFAVHALKIVYKDSVATVNAFPYEKQDGKVTLQNSSKSNVLTGINAVVHAPTGMQFKITSTTCGAPLVPGASCVYNYTYQAPPESQVTEEYTRSNVDFDITYTNASASFTLEYPIQVLQFKYGHFVNLPVDVTGYNGISSNDVFGVVTRGNVIYATTRLGFSISKDGGISWTNFTNSQSFNNTGLFVNNYGKAIYLFGNNRINSLLMSRDNCKTWTHITTAIIPYSPRGVFATDDGNEIFVGTSNGLYITNDSGVTWKRFSVDQGLVDNMINGVFADHQGEKIYIGTKNGLSISTDGGNTWKNYTTSEGLIDNDIRDLWASDDGSKIYVSCGAGLSLSTDSGKSWNNISIANIPHRLAVSADGMRIYSLNYAAMQFSVDGGNTWHNLPLPNGASGNDIFVSPDGSHIYIAIDSWFAEDGGLLVSTDGGINWTRQKLPGIMNSDNVYNVYAKGSNIYATTLKGLSISKDDGRTWKNYTNKEGMLSDIYTSGLHVSKDESRIYVSSNSFSKGLSISSDAGKTWKNYNKPEGLANGDVNKVYVSSDGLRIYAAILNGDFGVPGALSVSTDGGNKWTNYNTVQGLYSDDITALYASEDGVNLYVVSGVRTPPIGGVSISHDSGKTWSNYHDLGFVENYLNDIFVSQDGSKIYVVGDYGFTRSLNGGITWEPVLTSATRSWSMQRILSNDDGKTVYIASIEGLLFNDGKSTNWQLYSNGQGLYNPSMGIYITPDNVKIYVAQWGSGVSFTYLKKPTTK